MGFSVSASAAIIFISFLVAASTLYTAWDNSYTNVQAAQEDWYSLRLSWIHSDVGVSSITSDGENVTVYFVNNGTTLSAKHLNILRDGTYSSTLDLNYLLPGDTIGIVHYYVSDGTHAFTYVFDNGCELRFEFTKSGTSIALNNQEWYCPTEVN